MQRSLLDITHLAHHPNDPAPAADGARAPLRWEQGEAAAVISFLATLIRQAIS
jgi:hypothetical protein